MVLATTAITESSATLTSCSTKSAPSGPECGGVFRAKEKAQSSVGPRGNEHDRIISDTYFLQHQE
jgi:hypothetical protein